MQRMLVLGCLAFGILSGRAAAADAGPTRESCGAAIADAKARAEALPRDSLSRYFAERDLQQAAAEGGNGEFDDCLDWAGRAKLELSDPRHQLAPGETFTIPGVGIFHGDPPPAR